MASYAGKNLRIADDAGNVVPNAWIEVRLERAGRPLVQIFADHEGTTPLGNPFQTDQFGRAAFFAPGGFYRIRAYTVSPAWEDTFEWEAIGTAAATDFGTALFPADAIVVTLAARAAYDGEAAGFAVIVLQDADGPTLYWKQSAAAADWSAGTPLQGPAGAPGSAQMVATSATPLAIGTGTKTWTLDQADRGYAVGARIVATSDADPANRRMSGVIAAYGGTTLEVAVDTIVGAGTYADWTIALSGERGPAGADGSDPGALFTWDAATTDADPGAGEIRANDADLSTATQLYVSKLNRMSDDVSAYLLALAASSNPTAKGLLTLTHAADNSQAMFQVTGVADAGDYVKVAVQGHSGATAFVTSAPISFQFARAGDAGSMSGPASSVDGEIPEFDGASGTALRGSGATFPLDGTSVALDASDIANDSGVPGSHLDEALDNLAADDTPADEVNDWTAAQRTPIVPVAVVAGVALLDLSQGHHFAVTLSDDATLAVTNPPGAGTSQPGLVEIVQDATGGRAVTFDDGTVGAAGLIDGSGASPAPPGGTDANRRTVYSMAVMGDGAVQLTLMGDRVPS
ncbi:hypothetical protein HW532_12735 [Kaustia mangrovi]|uniref:Uncharacterized protein n=1 Tax=Kaustia mangrovi TaxID=2593653 RepID=A0A7S8HCI4_9HYPH|nr:hypothetical protein [Kaustia mangrovi]QPC43484.1 hypothetical protein HW532_12735 [Kaustia mangrovi]